jgi:predicted MPP superfamily phosphohydrolase
MIEREKVILMTVNLRSDVYYDAGIAAQKSLTGNLSPGASRSASVRPGSGGNTGRNMKTGGAEAKVPKNTIYLDYLRKILTEVKKFAITGNNDTLNAQMTNLLNTLSNTEDFKVEDEDDSIKNTKNEIKTYINNFENQLKISKKLIINEMHMKNLILYSKILKHFNKIIYTTVDQKLIREFMCDWNKINDPKIKTSGGSSESASEISVIGALETMANDISMYIGDTLAPKKK